MISDLTEQAELRPAPPRPAIKVQRIAGMMATKAKVLLKFSRGSREGKSFRVKRAAPKKKAAKRATCNPDMEKRVFKNWPKIRF